MKNILTVLLIVTYILILEFEIMYMCKVCIYIHIYIKISGACGCAFNDFTTLRFVFLVRGPGIMPEAGHEREEQVINSKHRPLKLKPHSEVRLSVEGWQRV